MLIESEKILAAKEKLGDQNAFLMAEALGLDDFDERNLKACCPYHNEDTPSFIYDKKNMRFHCLSHDTKIMTKTGTMKISQIVNTPIEIINGNGEWEQTRFVSCGVQKLLKICLKSRNKYKEIYATPEHEWIVRQKTNKIQTHNLTKGDVLETMWIHHNENLTPDIEGMKHGFIYGDGSFHKFNKTEQVNVFHAHIHTQEKLDFCRSVFNEVKSPPPKREGCLGTVYLKTTRDAKKPPIDTENPNYILGFLAGYFVADGNCTDETVQIASAKYEELSYIKHLFDIVGIPSYNIGSHTRTPKSNMGILTLEHDQTMYNLRLVKALIPEKFYVSQKRPQIASKTIQYMRWHVISVEPTDREEEVFCCETSTHSFVLEDYILTGNCFGCQKTVDILDVFMETGMTYIEACEKLFEVAKIPYSFGEKGVRTKAQYRYPKQEQAIIKDQVEHYLGVRGISPETITQLDIRQDNHGNCVFNYYDTNDVLTMVKYRPSHAIDKAKGEIKNWAQKDADTAPLLYNMNKINVAMPLLITEGEIDCAAAIECGYHNAVSVPFGAGNFTWIEHNWDWLEQFESIIIASDNDEAGQKMRKEVVYRLGSWRCKIVEIPTFYEKEDGKRVQVSDINEMMYWFGKDAVLTAIINAKDQPVASVVDFSDVNEVDLSEIDGIYTGIEEFDKEMMRLFYGTFNIVTGVNGCVDCETEFHNGKEWKRIADYEPGEMVLQYNPLTCRGEYVFPERYYKYPCKQFLHFTCHDFTHVVSKEHTLVFYQKSTNKFVRYSAIYAYMIWQAAKSYDKYGKNKDENFYKIASDLFFITDKMQIQLLACDCNWYQYSDGYKYCFTVPTHTLILRRMGTVFITGNSGKSSWLSQLICQSVDQGKDVWLYSRELPNYMSKNWINYIFAGNRHIKKYVDDRNSVYYKVTPEARQVIDEYYKNHIYIYRDDYENTVESVKMSMEDSVRKYGSKLLILDNLTAINMNCTDNEKWSKQVDLVNWCIDFAKKFHVVVILVIHPKKIETMRRLTKFDVQGLGSIVDLAHRLISLYRVTPKDKAGERRRDGRGWFREPIKYDVMCDILKDRMRGRENLSIGLYYDPSSRRFFTNEKEYAYQYKWDNINYSTPLPKPKQLYEPEEEEVFGHVYE